MQHEENYSEWLNNFSVEKQEDNLFLVKNNNSGTYTITTNFDINTATYSGRIFETVENFESALRIFQRVLDEMITNKKAGALC